MPAAALAGLAGISFGALSVAIRWGTARTADPEVGAFVAATFGAGASFAIAAPSLANQAPATAALLPFLAAGLVAPGVSQILLTVAVRDAGASRAAMFMGMAPLISILIALTLLDEPFRLFLLVGTVLIVAGGVVSAVEPTRPEHFRARGVALALVCAALFAARDNLLRWSARDEHPPPLVAATASLLAAAVLILVYLAVVRRGHLRAELVRATPAFAPAGIALALGYDALLAALDRGRVSLVSPLNATGALWAVLLAALVIGRSESIGRRTVLAAFLIVAGGALIGVVG
jgi:drug/metabolite transporter (DMT)-like permease